MSTRLFLSLLFSMFVLQARTLALPSRYSPFDVSKFENPDDVDVDITLNQLNQVLGNFTCKPTQQFAEECRNSTDALPLINQGFADYNISSVGEKAALLSLMVFETGNFSFDRNHFPPPGRPGQGTRNLMQFPFVYQYAVDNANTSSQALSLVPNNTTDLDSVSDDTKNAVRKLVLGDQLSFSSAMWFYTQSGKNKTGCTHIDGMVEGLQVRTVAGWENYITQCIGTTVTDDRQKVWEQTLKALISVN
ncbi:hypothetical protein D9758_013022 [Tetrapyrgos nigripes]|uniref:Uncharacterized protein n=1 Tax=Tetrapyrgos nigripes TaxID=182062 RepID=A0A8H5C9F2_9AGAR|nr:hypothetical protein D9758_013022 [Tetrapyrgos nigripes]